MEQRKMNLAKLEPFKYPLLILLLGVALMLLPGSAGQNEAPEDSGAQLQQLLSSSEGVGEARVLVSEKGVVVVCTGAENAEVRLRIIKAVSVYTGFGSDRITILKLAQ